MGMPSLRMVATLNGLIKAFQLTSQPFSVTMSSRKEGLAPWP
jgi:hypothetical protein